MVQQTADYATEEWRPVAGYEDRYQVSNLGRVRGIKRRKRIRVPRVLRQHVGNKGYFQIGLGKDNRVKTRYVHQLVATAFIGPRPEGHLVNHIEGIKINNRVENLEYVTPSGNMRHALTMGLLVRDKKITPAFVREIRERAKTQSSPELADEYGVNRESVSDIVRGKTWWWL